jgi:hypothetical protein
LAEGQVHPNRISRELHKTEVLVAVAVVTPEQKEQELQVLLAKVMTVALHLHLVMVAEVVLVRQVEMEIPQIVEPLLVQVE